MAVSNTMAQTKSSHQQTNILILCLQTTERRMEYTLRRRKISSEEIAKHKTKINNQRYIITYENIKKDSRFQLIEDIIVLY